MGEIALPGKIKIANHLTEEIGNNKNVTILDVAAGTGIMGELVSYIILNIYSKNGLCNYS